MIAISIVGGLAILSFFISGLSNKTSVVSFFGLANLFLTVALLVLALSK